MEDLILVATYKDEEYGLVEQYLDSDDNTIFYSVMIDDNGNKNYQELGNDVSRILEEKYFGTDSDIDES